VIFAHRYYLENAVNEAAPRKETPISAPKVRISGSRPIAFVDLAAQRQRLGARIDRAIGNVLEHGQYILGPEVKTLEDRLAAHSGARHVIGCSSGTDALILALMALETKPGDAVFVPSFSFAATAEAVALVGATPVFVDIEETSFNLNPGRLGDAIEEIKRAGRLRPAGIIAVDLFGQPADFPAINRLAEAHGLWVIADAAQSYGATTSYGEGGAAARVGTLARITATSFFPAKPLGCYGDGGAVFTDDADLAAIIRSTLVHGQGADKYDNVRIGLNARLDTIQAAILIEKLSIFDDEVAKRQAVAARYNAGLKSRVTTPNVGRNATSVWAQYTIVAERRDRIAANLREQGIPTAIYYPKPLHRQTAYRHFPVAGGSLPCSDRLAAQVLSLPMHPYLDAVTQDRIIDAVLRALD
jgi:dTDP-4-amino-4,6-dideoxygalactose transaminase